jgi:acetyl esterase/lipase
MALTLGGLAIQGCAAENRGAGFDLAVRLQQSYKVVPNVVYVVREDWVGKLDLYYPQDAPAAPPVLLFFHGGGWDGGSKESATLGLVPYLEMGFAVLNVEYRLTGQALAPAAVDDCRCALAWAHRYAEAYYFDANRIVLAGDSAGGQLALITGMLSEDGDPHETCKTLEDPDPVPIGPARVAAIINWEGPTDVAELVDGAHAAKWAKKWLGERPDRAEIARSVSPLDHVRPGLPPILTVHGELDTVVPYSQAVRFHAALAEADVPNRLISVQDGTHEGFGEKETVRIYEGIHDFLRKHGILGPDDRLLKR